ncbi:MAG: hypothetical protein AB7N73_12470 [Gemmatimonadales bacterium]|jgi:hypothetical protein
MRNPLARIAAGALLASTLVLGAPVALAAQSHPALAANTLPMGVDPPREICNNSDYYPFRVTASARMRTDADLNRPVIATVPAGTIVTSRCYIDWGASVGGNPVWRHVVLADGRDGWMSDTVLQPVPVD